MNAVTIEWINEGKDIANYLQLMKGDERYNFSTLFNSAKEMIEGRTATNNNVGAILNVCKILSDQPLKLNIDRNYITQLTATGDVLYDIHLLRALEGIDISGVDDSHYEELAKIAYCYTDTYGIWGKTLTYRNSTMVKVMGWLIKNNKHKGQPNEEKDIITEMANIKNILDISYQSLITFVNDWGKVALNNNEKNSVLANVFVGEDWPKAFLAVENPLSRAILNKYYHDFNEQSISSFINTNTGWEINSYWLKTLNVLVEDERFIKECSGKLIEITNRVVEGICIGSIADGNANMNLQKTLLKQVGFAEVSTKVNEMMGRFDKLKINKFIFLSLHHYMKKTKGYETQFLNNILRPIINDSDVQGVILNNLVFYEPLIKENIVQASELKTELIKIHNNSSDEKMKAMIERLNIIEPDKQISKEGNK